MPISILKKNSVKCTSWAINLFTPVLKKKIKFLLTTKPDRAYIILSFLFALLITFFSFEIPFFWDNIALSEVACYYYDTSFDNVIAPAQSDFGAFTLYAFYLPIVWTLFGKTLLVSHMALLPFVIGILWEVKKISLLLIRPTFLPLVYILIMFDPAFSTQLLLMGYDIFMLYWVLLCTRLLWEKRYIWYSLSLICLSSVSIRAIVYMVSLFVIHLITIFIIDKQKFRLRDAAVYLPTMLFLSAWFVYHYQKTGWWFVNPVYDSQRQSNEANMILRQLGYILWKLIDSGRIIVWGFCIVGVLNLLKKQIVMKMRKFLIYLFIPLMISSLLMIFISNPIGHKYFLQTFIFINILSIYFLQHYVTVQKRVFVFMLLILSLIGGNFIIYPQKYGNAWDTSLKVLPFFNLEKQMHHLIHHHKIPSEKIFTEFPLNVDRQSSYLVNSEHYKTLNHDSIQNHPYVLYSNLINTSNIKTYNYVIKNWHTVFYLEKYQIRIGLYENPGYFQPNTIIENHK